MIVNSVLGIKKEFMFLFKNDYLNEFYFELIFDFLGKLMHDNFIIKADFYSFDYDSDSDSDSNLLKFNYFYREKPSRKFIENIKNIF